MDDTTTTNINTNTDNDIGNDDTSMVMVMHKINAHINEQLAVGYSDDLRDT